MLELISKGLKLLLLLSLALLDEFLHFNLVLRLFGLNLCNFSIMGCLHLLYFFIVDVLLSLVLLPELFSMLFHLFANYFVF